MHLQAHPSPVHRRRGLRQFLILPKFQLLVIGINVGVTLIMAVILWAQTRNALENLAPTARLSGLDIEFYRNYLDYQARAFQESLGISLVVGLVISIVTTLVITHRISGPMFRMKGYFRAICEGKFPDHPLEFRDGDYFEDLPPLINKAIRQISAREKKSA